MNQSWCSKICTLLRRFSFLLLFFVLILAWHSSYAIAQENGNTKESTSPNDSPCVVELAENQPLFKPTTGKIKETNSNFHQDYDRLIIEESTKFGHPNGSTVLIVSGTKITFCHNGNKQTDQLAYDPNIFHILKAIGHQPLALNQVSQIF